MGGVQRFVMAPGDAATVQHGLDVQQPGRDDNTGRAGCSCQAPRCVELINRYMGQLGPRWKVLSEVQTRVEATAAGAADLHDLIALDGCAQVLFDVARVVEGCSVERWRSVVTASESFRAVLEASLGLHPAPLPVTAKQDQARHLHHLGASPGSLKPS